MQAFGKIVIHQETEEAPNLTFSFVAILRIGQIIVNLET